MIQFAEYLLTAALVFAVIALVTNLILVSASKRTSPRHTSQKLAYADAPACEVPPAGGSPTCDGVQDGTCDGVQDGRDIDSAQSEGVNEPGPGTTAACVKPKPASPVTVAHFAAGLEVVALALLTAYSGIRIGLTGHGPFANQHEFAVSFAWGILAGDLIAQWRFRVRMISLVVLPVAACMLFFAIQIGVELNPLVPALQNNLLLTLHVGFAILSYGAACVSFAAAVLYLLHAKLHIRTPIEKLDEIGYKGAVVAFPLMTVMILLGSLWANTAWGRYWGWDPKETAALVTWLLYGAFLHARVARGWRGKKSAWLLVIGFAAVMFAYFGNYFFGGLHSYA